MQKAGSFLLLGDVLRWKYSRGVYLRRRRHETERQVRRGRAQTWLVTRYGNSKSSHTCDSTLVQQKIRSKVSLPILYFSFFADLYSASSFILLLRHTGSSRGCSPLQPSAGAARPCTRFSCATLSNYRHHSLLLHFYFFLSFRAETTMPPSTNIARALGMTIS